MTSRRRLPQVLFVSAVLSCAAMAGAWADPPSAPVLSTSINADDLVAQVGASVEELGKWLAAEKDYTEHKDQIKDEANALIVVTLVLAKHDSPHRMKKTAAGIIPAAQQLAKAKDFSSAQKSLADVQAAVGSTAEAKEPDWARMAGLGSTMRRVATTHTKLRNSLKRLDPKRSADNARAATVLAAVGQAIIYDTHEVKNPDDLPKWHALSVEMRDACGELSKAIRSGDKGAATSASARVQKNCDACHEVFQH